VAISWYKEKGYLPEALINFLCLLGWSHPKGKDIFSLEEFIKYFSFERISKSAPIFDFKKLDWLNGVYIRQKKDAELLKLLKPFAPKGMTDDLIGKTIPLIKERLVKLSDYPSLVDFLIEEPKVDKKLLIKKGGGDSNLIKKQFEIILKELEKAGWETSKLETLFREIAQTQKFHIGKFFMAVRIALTGKTATPPLFEMMEVLGKEKTTLRIKKSLALLS
jgi:glutamyl/glutaminyl-tRNA synthetase